ncbi:hypothetical protein ACIPSR_19300 [Pectobacterium sp. CHL-2024]|uniref:hypothetical protein n=1 Tax=Pectobacterium sp. CHL-2024 TaxID=3377079 RepID=UPI0038057DC7
MQIKDQRLEFRISSEQLEKIDDIVKGANPLFKVNRSDVIRNFVDQGINKYLNESNVNAIPENTIQKLNTFFITNDSNSKNFELIKYVYENDLVWFFSLSDIALKEIFETYYGIDKSIYKTLNKRRSDDYSDCFSRVAGLLSMFSKIDYMMKKNDYDDGLSELRDEVMSRADALDIPLKFHWFGNNSVIENQMADLIIKTKELKIDSSNKSKYESSYSKKYDALYSAFSIGRVDDLYALKNILTAKNLMI